MRKSIRNSIIISAILILCGAVITFIALAMAEFDFSRLSTDNQINGFKEITEPFSNINIKISTSDLKIAQSNNGECSLEYICPDDFEYNISVSDGTLNITEKDNRKWNDYIGIYIGKTEMTLYLPEKEYTDFAMESDTGDIAVPNSVYFRNAKVETDTGDVDWLSAVTEKLDISSDTGDITLKNLNPQTLSVETDTGDISVESLISDGNVKIKSDTGDVKLLKSDAGSFELETNTGDISGTLLSDKVFLTKSKTGDIDVPSSISGGECSIKTDTGDISFKIEKNK